MRPPSRRSRYSWRYDIVVDLDVQPEPEASTPGELVPLVKATGAHMERRRRRWRRVR